jgi:hypothetical protein
MKNKAKLKKKEVKPVTVVRRYIQRVDSMSFRFVTVYSNYSLAFGSTQNFNSISALEVVP